MGPRSYLSRLCLRIGSFGGIYTCGQKPAELGAPLRARCTRTRVLLCEPNLSPKRGTAEFIHRAYDPRVSVVPAVNARTAEDPASAPDPALAEQISCAYVGELSRAASPLVACEELVHRRRQRARIIVEDVLAYLGFRIAEPSAPDPWPAVQELVNGHASPGEEISASHILFAVALHRLCRALPLDPEDIACALNRRLSADMKTVADALIKTDALQSATREIINRELLATRLTEAQSVVFEMLYAGLSVEQIADRLCISRKTVSNHRSAIGERLGAKGWLAMVRRARELGMLVVVPAIAAAAAWGDSAAAVTSLM